MDEQMEEQERKPIEKMKSKTKKRKSQMTSIEKNKIWEIPNLYKK